MDKIIYTVGGPHIDGESQLIDSVLSASLDASDAPLEQGRSEYIWNHKPYIYKRQTDVLKNMKIEKRITLTVNIIEKGCVEYIGYLLLYKVPCVKNHGQ